MLRAAVFLGVAMIAASSAIAQHNVLWDTSHGVYVTGDGWSQDPDTGAFAPMAGHVSGYGFTFDTTSVGVLVDDPAGYDVIVVGVGGAWDSAYTVPEVARIVDFVNAGGGLLLMADNTLCPNENIQPVATAFGIGVGVSNVALGDYHSPDLGTHPIFDGIDSIVMASPGEVTAGGLSSLIAWEEGGAKGLIAAGTLGGGRVVALGDSNLFLTTDLAYYNAGDNRLFSVSLFEYLAGDGDPGNSVPAVPAPAAVLLGTLGAGLVGWMRRRRAL